MKLFEIPSIDKISWGKLARANSNLAGLSTVQLKSKVGFFSLNSAGGRSNSFRGFGAAILERIEDQRHGMIGGERAEMLMGVCHLL